MAPLRYAAKFDPFLSWDCARVEGVWGRNPGKEGIKFCHLATLIPPFVRNPSELGAEKQRPPSDVSALALAHARGGLVGLAKSLVRKLGSGNPRSGFQGDSG